MTYAKKTLSEIKLIHGNYGNFIKGQKLDKKKEKKYKMPPYQDLAASNEIDGEPLDEKCWPGYEKKGMKTMFGKRYPNCVKKKKTRKEEFSDWRSELNEKKESGKDKFNKNTIKGAKGPNKKSDVKLPNTKSNVKSLNMASVKPGEPITAKARGMINRLLGGVDTSREDKLSKNIVNQAKKSKNSASFRAYKDVVKGTAPRRGLAKFAAKGLKAISKTPKGALVAGGLIGAVAGARAIGRKFNEIRKKRRDAAIDKQVDKYVADRKGPIRKVNYMPDNMYTVKRDKDGKVTGTGDKIRVVPGTRTIKRMPKPGERTSVKSRFSQNTRMKLGNYGSLSPMDEATMTPAQKRKDTMLKKKYEKSDDMMKSFKDQYGEKEGEKIFYAKIRKDAMKEELNDKDVPVIKGIVKKLEGASKKHKDQSIALKKAVEENTAIESELVIQDWNVDDIKFTEIETVDIIKAKPLKESMTDKEFMDTKIKMQSGKYKASQDEQDAYVKEVNRRRINTGPGEFKLNYKTDKTVKDHYNWREDLGEDVISKLKMKLLNKKEGGTSKPGFPPIKTIEKRVKVDEDWQKVNRKDKTDGLSRKAVKAYRRENPGSKLQTAVTKDPKKLKKGSKSAKRRLSFCRRMKGMKKKLTSAKTRRDPDSRINKALRRWNC